MDSLLKELESFRGREEDLRKITRYSLYSPMWYRTSLWSHSRRSAWIAQVFSPRVQTVFESFSGDKAYALALVHDDAEIIMGDIQAGNKSKMSQNELKEIEHREERAIDVVAKRFPASLGVYDYKQLLLEMLHKTSIEAVVVDWADKYDAFGEALHELHAGNRVWSTHVVNQYGIIPLPTEYYDTYFNKFVDKFPQSKIFFQSRPPIFQIPTVPDIEKILERGEPHEYPSIRQKTGYDPYDFWKDITLTNGTEEDIRDLCARKE